jgi:hypothetical protein
LLPSLGRCKKDAKIMFFENGRTGKPLLQMHPENERFQEAVEIEYSNRVLKEGVVCGVRGEPWAVLSKSGDTDDPDGVPPFLMVQL